MKQITFLAVIVALFAASCSNKNGMFTKRKYTKGHYIAHVGKVEKPQVRESKQTPVLAAAPIKTEYVVPSKNIENNSAVAVASNVKASASHAVKPVSVAKSNQTQASAKPSFAKKVTNLRAANKIKNAKKESTSDDNLIIWVILSLFPILALIAVYLHDGKSITLNFWVDLVLHFVALYWLFALLVVLDIFTLA